MSTETVAVAPPMMSAVKKVAAESLTLVEVPTPVLGADDVLVRIRACAICASDLFGWATDVVGDGTPGRWDASNPGLTGHEMAGDIVAVGSRVPPERLQEPIWIDPVVGCGVCPACREGRQTACPGVRTLCQGFAEYIAAPHRQCRPIPEGFDHPHASLIADMVGTPIGAVKRAEILPGESVAVWGLGPVGLGMIQAARIAGASVIAGVDLVASRRRLAERLGATVSYAPDPQTLGKLQQLTGGDGFDVVLCAVGHESAARQGFESLRLGGRMVTVAGFPPAGGDVAKWVTGSWACDRLYWDEAVEHLTAGRFRVDSYITHTFPLAEVDRAFKLRAHRPDESLKVVMTNDPL